MLIGMPEHSIAIKITRAQRRVPEPRKAVESANGKAHSAQRIFLIT